MERPIVGKRSREVFRKHSNETATFERASSLVGPNDPETSLHPRSLQISKIREYSPKSPSDLYDRAPARTVGEVPATQPQYRCAFRFLVSRSFQVTDS